MDWPSAPGLVTAVSQSAAHAAPAAVPRPVLLLVQSVSGLERPAQTPAPPVESAPTNKPATPSLVAHGRAANVSNNAGTSVAAPSPRPTVAKWEDANGLVTTVASAPACNAAAPPAQLNVLHSEDAPGPMESAQRNAPNVAVVAPLASVLQ